MIQIVKVRTDDYNEMKNGGYIEDISQFLLYGYGWFYPTEYANIIVSKTYGAAYLHIASSKTEMNSYINTIKKYKKKNTDYDNNDEVREFIKDMNSVLNRKCKLSFQQEEPTYP